jgi:hypothetical protein
MQLDLANLPTDTALLHRLARHIATTIEHNNSEIGRLKSIIKQLQRAQFGRRSERLDPDQLALGLEDLDSDLAREEECRPQVERQQTERSSHRKPLPDHLPRADVRLDLDNMTCACCGETLHLISESVSEMLDWIPAQLRVIRTTRPKYACRTCETVVQAPAPERVIAGGLATPGTACPGVGQQILRSHAALSAVADLPATALISCGRRSPDGSAAPAGGSRRCTNAYARMCSLRIICSPTTRRCRCSIRTWADEDRTSLGLCPRATRLGRTGAAGGGLSVRARPQS